MNKGLIDSIIDEAIEKDVHQINCFEKDMQIIKEINEQTKDLLGSDCSEDGVIQLDQSIKQVEQGIDAIKVDTLDLIKKTNEQVVNLEKFDGIPVPNKSKEEKQKAKAVAGVTVAGCVVAGAVYAVGFVPVMTTFGVGGTLYMVGSKIKEQYYGKN